MKNKVRVLVGKFKTQSHPLLDCLHRSMSFIYANLAGQPDYMIVFLGHANKIADLSDPMPHVLRVDGNVDDAVNWSRFHYIRVKKGDALNWPTPGLTKCLVFFKAPGGCHRTPASKDKRTRKRPRPTGARSLASVDVNFERPTWASSLASVEVNPARPTGASSLVSVEVNPDDI